MAQDIFASSPDIDIRKRWALMQLQNASDASPVHHPLQAVARALQGAMGGYMANQAGEEDKAAGAAMFNNLPGINPQPSPQAAPTAPAVQSPPPAMSDMSNPMGNAPRGIRNNNALNIENGPFAMSQPGYAGTDGRFAKFASADNGLGAASKLLDTYNSKYGLDTVGGIVNRWAPAGDGNNVSAYAQSVAKTMGVDPTAKLDLANPEVKQALILAMGKHENGVPITAPNPAIAMAQNPPVVPGQAPTAPQASPMQTAQAAPQNAPVGNRSSVQIPPDVQATIQRLGSDPRTRGQALQLYMQYAKPVESIQPMTPEQRKQWQIPDGMSAGVDTVTGKPIFSPPQTNVNLNTAQKGQEVMATESAQDFKAAQQASREAVKRSPVWDQMEQASKGFTPGATAEMKLGAKKYLKDLGLISGEDVPDAQTFQQLQQQLAIHAQPKGQGAVSNFEREMYAKSIANMNMDPEALSRAIKIGRSLDEFDRKVAQVYRENARKNGGVPNSIDINDEIEKLGSPLGTADMNYLRRNSEKGAAKESPASAQPAQNAAPDRAAIEAEMKRRGLK